MAQTRDRRYEAIAEQSGARSPGEVWLQAPAPRGGSRWLHFSNPHELLTARSIDQVDAVLATAEAATREGLWAAGMLSYEAAPAFDPAFKVHPADSLPLAWFGIFDPPLEVSDPGALSANLRGGCSITDWQPTVDGEEYAAQVRSIRQWIEAGDTYQVNLTLRLRGRFRGDPRAFFQDLQRAQRARYGAWLDLGDHVVASASPELFFRLTGDRLIARPMKGTTARGRGSDEDREQGIWLTRSEKNRAENLMIVDMVRNDLGRIAVPGSVRVRSLFDLERYPSLYQLTSTIEARSRSTPREILAALFPSASITGAPKIRTMEFICELESTPRGIYTGSIGYLAPERRAQFNVAIRGVHFDRLRGTAEYGTGGGIVWDSSADDESREWRTKALILARPTPRFQLIETLRWTRKEGCVRLERHLSRLAASADYFGFRCHREAILSQLERLTATLQGPGHRIRLLLAEDGAVSFDTAPLPASGCSWRLALAPGPVDSTDRWLFHKTTVRQTYEEARAAWPEHDDVLLWNERGELTESTIANLVVEVDGRPLTPTLDCGLLAGTYRAELLERGEIDEARVTLEDLRRADAVWLVNSLRGRIPAMLDRATLSRKPRRDSAG